MQFKSFEPNIEVLGQAMYSILDGFGAFKKSAEKLMIENGLGEMRGTDFWLDPTNWYSLDKWLKVFELVSKDIGDTSLFMSGRCIPKNAKFPPWVKDIESALKSIDIAYHMNHKKSGKEMFDPNTGKMLEGIGHYGYEKIPNKNMIISICNTPYSCEFDRGILIGLASKFEIRAAVTHDKSKPCRKSGSESCTYIITY